MNEVLISLQENPNKPIYIHGQTCSGKTKLLKEIKNSEYLSLDEITCFEDLENKIKPNVFDLFQKKKERKIAIIDNIDILNIQDKKILGIILNHLKEEKKRKVTRNFSIIFSGINTTEKKIKEIMDLSYCIEMNKNITLNCNHYVKKILDKKYKHNPYLLVNEKTLQSLLFHENIIYYLKTENHLYFYYCFLENISIGDYYDRVCFQKQLWIFNDFTYYIKVLHNYYLYKLYKTKTSKRSICFTKVLTKYSNEFQNLVFVQKICNEHLLDKNELYQKLIKKDKNIIKVLSENQIKRLHNLFNINIITN